MTSAGNGGGEGTITRVTDSGDKPGEVRHIGGNKWRKLKYNLALAREQNKTRLLTFGGAWSNHMLAHFGHQLPVLDERQRIVGMVSEHELLRVMVIEDAELSFVRGKTVADVMSPEVITADPVTDVRRIARVMCAYALSAVPIVDERDALIGLVSRTDILNSVANDPPLSLWS